MLSYLQHNAWNNILIHGPNIWSVLCSISIWIVLWPVAMFTKETMRTPDGEFFQIRELSVMQHRLTSKEVCQKSIIPFPYLARSNAFQIINVRDVAQLKASSRTASSGIHILVFFVFWHWRRLKLNGKVYFPTSCCEPKQQQENVF